MPKTYDILELQKLSIIELTSIAENNRIQIQNNFKQSLIYAILDRQVDSTHKEIECHSHDRYAVAGHIIN